MSVVIPFLASVTKWLFLGMLAWICLLLIRQFVRATVAAIVAFVTTFFGIQTMKELKEEEARIFKYEKAESPGPNQPKINPMVGGGSDPLPQEHLERQREHYDLVGQEEEPANDNDYEFGRRDPIPSYLQECLMRILSDPGVSIKAKSHKDKGDLYSIHYIIEINGIPFMMKSCMIKDSGHFSVSIWSEDGQDLYTMLTVGGKLPRQKDGIEEIAGDRFRDFIRQAA